MEVVQTAQESAVASRLAGTDVGESPDPTSRRFKVNLPSGFSFVVDDVDAGQEQGEPEEAEPEKAEVPQEQEPQAERVKQIQVEAESRKSEFARLLEEHAQVVRQLKQMESDEGPQA